MTMSSVTMVEVSKRYGDIVALDSVSLEVGEGEYVCVIGPSGSGKSTFLRIIAGIVKPDEGEVYIGERMVNDVPIEERGVGIVMQDILLFPHMTLWGNLTYGPIVQGAGYSKAEAIAREVVGFMKLTLRTRAYPDELSRGDQQKVAIARAIVAGARVLLLDEPFASIDPRAAKRLRFELKQLTRDLGLTVIHVTHNQEEALSVADKIVVMRRGRVEQFDTPLRLFSEPRTPFIVRFLGGEANFFEGRVVKSEENGVIVDIGLGKLVRGMGFHKVDERVIYAVRPEHVEISSCEKDGIGGVVEEVNLMGFYYRVVISVDGHRVVARLKDKFSFLKEGNTIKLRFKRGFVFKYPEEGLEEAIRYE